MPELNVLYPKSGRPVYLPATRKFFVASGTVLVREGGLQMTVRAKITHSTNNTIVVHGKLLQLFHEGKGGRTPGTLKWAFLFDVNPESVIDGEYNLRVESHYVATADGTALTSDDSTTVQRVGINRRPFLSITWPPVSEDVTDYKDYFVAYGEFTNDNAETAVMNSVNCDYLYSDSGFWCAQFPPLATGTYTLLVTDMNNGSASASGLRVRE